MAISFILFYFNYLADDFLKHIDLEFLDICCINKSEKDRFLFRKTEVYIVKRSS